MPQIPTLNDRVQVSNLPSVRIQAFDTGAQAIGQGLGNFANATLQIAERERQRADAAQLLEADTAMALLEDTLFHDPENGAYSKRGKDALAVPDSLWPEWEKREGEIRANLPAHLQGQFGQFANSRRRDLSRSLTRHITQESDKYYGELSEAYITTAANSASSNYTDPDRIDTEVARAIVGIEGTGILEGKPDEWKKAKRQEIESRIRAGALDRMIADDPITAQAYYEKHKDSFLGETQAKVERLLKPLVMREEVRVEAAKYAGMSYTDALKKARDIADPDLRDGVLREIDFSEKIRVAAENQQNEQMGEDISTVIERADPSTPLTDILSPQQLAWAQEHGKVAGVETRLRQRLEGQQPRTDFAELARLDALMTQAQEGNAEAQASLRKENPVGWYDKLDRPMWEHLKERRAAILNPADKAVQDALDDYASEKDQLDTEVWGPLGIPTSGKLNTQNNEMKGQFLRSYYERKRVFVEQTQRPPNATERREMMRELLVTRTWPKVRPILWDTEEELHAFETDVEIPNANRAAIRAAFKATHAGAEPTEAEVQMMYYRAKNEKVN